MSRYRVRISYVVDMLDETDFIVDAANQDEAEDLAYSKAITNGLQWAEIEDVEELPSPAQMELPYESDM